MTLLEAFQALPAQPDADELDSALLVNQALKPDLDVEMVRAEVMALAPDAGVPVWEHLAALGFRGDDSSYHSLDNSCISEVLLRRRGIPITLSVLLLSIARSQGLPALGLNAPGHFLSQIGEHVIDPFSMQVMQIDGVIEPAGPVEVAVRMLNNVKHNLVATGETARALDMLDYQLAMLDGHSAAQNVAMLLLEKGEYWRTLGANDLAVEAYLAAAERAGAGSEIATVCQARVERLAGASPNQTFH